MSKLIEKVTSYVCPYCISSFQHESDAIDCLNNHDIVFTVKTPTYSHDCWGSRECDYSDSGKVFKTYKKANKYAKANNGEIGFKELG